MVVANELQGKKSEKVKKHHPLQEIGDELTGIFVSDLSVSSPSVHIHQDVSSRPFSKQMTYH